VLHFISTQRKGSAKWEGEIKTQHLQMKMAYQQSKANEVFMKTHFSSMLDKLERSLSPLLHEEDNQMLLMQTNSEASLELSGSLASDSTSFSVPATQQERTVILPAELSDAKCLSQNQKEEADSSNEIRDLEEAVTNSSLDALESDFLSNIFVKKAGEVDNEVDDSKNQTRLPLSMSALMETSKTVVRCQVIGIRRLFC